MRQNINWCIVLAMFYFGCMSNYEEGKQAFQDGRFQDASQLFTKARPDRNSTDKEKVEAANALSVLQSMEALDGKKYSLCISRAKEVFKGEWKSKADSIIVACDNVFRDDIQAFINSKNYTALLECFLAADSSRPVFKDALSLASSLSEDIQQCYLNLPTEADLERQIRFKEYQINEYSKLAAGCNETVQWGTREILGDELRAKQMAEAYVECQRKMADIRSEMNELENRKRIFVDVKWRLASLFYLLTGRTIKER